MIRLTYIFLFITFFSVLSAQDITEQINTINTFIKFTDELPSEKRVTDTRKRGYYEILMNEYNQISGIFETLPANGVNTTFYHYYFDYGKLIAIREFTLQNKKSDLIRITANRLYYFDYEGLIKDSIVMKGKFTSTHKTLLTRGYDQYDYARRKYLESDPFTKLQADSVYAYIFNIKMENGKLNRDYSEGNIVNPDNKTLHHSALLPGRKLNQTQTKKIIAAVTDTLSYGYSHSACFIPRMGFVFYKSGKIAGHISICLECNGLSTWPYSSASELLISYRPGKECMACHGFSPKGQQRIKELCLELDLKLCETQNDRTDKE